MVRSGAHDYSELYRLFKEPDIMVVFKTKRGLGGQGIWSEWVIVKSHKKLSIITQKEAEK
jgi:hypothetical protein